MKNKIRIFAKIAKVWKQEQPTRLKNKICFIIA